MQKLEEKIPAITKPPGTLYSEGKEAISARVTVGKDALYTKLQAGSEAIGNTRAGLLVGSGVGRTLAVTERVVDYLLPAAESDKENASESEEKENEPPKGEEFAPPSAAARVAIISQKLKVRVYYRSLRKLQAAQQQCKAALSQLEEHVHVVSGGMGGLFHCAVNYRCLYHSL